MARPSALADKYTRQAGTEPIPGYRLLAPLGRGAYGEVWKCRVPGGLDKALKIVEGDLRAPEEDGEAKNASARQELEALERIKAIRHPFILSIERLEIVDGALLIVTELADRSLADVLQYYQAKG